MISAQAAPIAPSTGTANPATATALQNATSSTAPAAGGATP